MTIDEVKELITDYAKLVSTLTGLKTNTKLIEAAIKQYDVTKHEIFDEVVRPNKLYTADTGPATSLVARLAVPFQKQIVNRAATFLCGNPIELVATPSEDKQKNLLAALKKVWEDSKLDYKSKEIAKLMMSEMEVAEIWYAEPLGADETDYWNDILGNNAKFKLRMRIIAKSLGDNLFPVYSPTGDMIAFGRGYSITLEGNKVEEHFDLYTAEQIYLGVKVDGTWTVIPQTNLYKKIPIIYYQQTQTEWADVQTLIDRFEEQLSNHADVNDYFGSPMLAVIGKIVSFAKKGESGKIVEIESGGSMQYLSWDQAPESVKLEMETLLKLIYSCTDTPNISFEEMKGLGTFSGFAITLLFMAAHMKSSDKEEIFGESIQRRINYLKSAIGTIDLAMASDKVQLKVKPKFEYYLPKDLKEKLDVLNNAVSGDLMSRESAVRQNPLIADPDKELILLQKQAESEASLNKIFN